MTKPRRGRLLLAALLSLALGGGAWALQGRVTSEASEDDAQLTLEVATHVILADAKTACRMRIVVGNEQVPFTAGDEVLLELWEDDGFFDPDDRIWQSTQMIAPSEVETGVDLEVDCSTNFASLEFGNTLEVYAKATVTKQACGLLCFYDRPQTPILELAGLTDDDAEPNDELRSAGAFGDDAARTFMVARDPDYYRLNLDAPATLTAWLRWRAGEGALELSLVNADDEVIAMGSGEDGELEMVAPNLAPGPVYLLVQPDGSDYNFYDLELDLTEGCLCEPGEMQSGPCGRCGTRTRVCGDACNWGEWGECGAEMGVCDPGDVESRDCGRCGSQRRSCRDTCDWTPFDACIEEGVCEPGAVEVDADACAEGARERRCGDGCAWSVWSDCESCADGDSEQCYPAPEHSRGVGPCQAGMRRCEGGVFGACEGAVLPAADDTCDDGIDNDCDGEVDEGCGAGPSGALGAACTTDADCVGLADGSCVDAQCVVQPCPGDGCGSSARCVELRSGAACAPGCEDAAECLASQRCEDRGGGGRACVPACDDDRDCRLPQRHLCDAGSGRCVPDPATCDGQVGCACADATGCAAGLQCEGGLCSEPAGGVPCTAPADCPIGQRCPEAGGTCVAGCDAAGDCADNEKCEANACVRKGGGGSGGCQQSAPSRPVWAFVLGALVLLRRRRR